METIWTDPVFSLHFIAIRCRYEPKPDITAYELALILPCCCSGFTMTQDAWERLGSASRHFVRTD